MLHVEDLRALAEIEAAHAVSAYLPTHTAGRETRQDPIRLKNLLDRAARELQEAGYRRPDVEELLAPGRALLDEEEFWRHQQQGLAVFAAPGFFRHERLPIEVAEEVVVGRRLHLKPLLPLLADGKRFTVLALTAGGARLLQGSRFACSEIEADLPHGVGEITAETEYDNERHAAPPARPRSAGAVGMPASHNFGEDPEEQRKTQLLQYLRRVVSIVEEHNKADRAPLVLVAQPEIQGHVRALAKSLSFVEGGVDLNPDALDEEELHRHAWETVQPMLSGHREREKERFMSLFGAGDPKALTVPEEIVRAAREGRVETLFLAEGEQLWGRFDEEQGRVEAHGSRGRDDEDLLDRAAIQTLLQGGRVEILPKDELPRSGLLMAAILRY
ncbi:MAG TPA: hypothetical protein VFG43_04705 [Geminicoccaceae bacterium]|nr:hypothetical protein [Geminicoccaceae bacterium]